MIDPFDLLTSRGDGRYGGEAVTQREHGCQAAWLATQAEASSALVLAALFHDVGHLLRPEESVETDLQHEELGARYLSRWFGSAVTEPVRRHVLAKRRLARREGYQETLSEESVRTLRLQGGPLSRDEAAAFDAHPWARAALLLRSWDDAAKRVDLRAPEVAHYRELIGPDWELSC